MIEFTDAEILLSFKLTLKCSYITIKKTCVTKINILYYSIAIVSDISKLNYFKVNIKEKEKLAY